MFSTTRREQSSIYQGRWSVLQIRRAPVRSSPTGAPASATTLSSNLSKPSVVISGFDALVLHSGLVPGSVGEYGVNATIPTGIAPGSAISVKVFLPGVESNAVTIALK
jgi:uncharacterized protein (TIGR03437 family)